MLVLSVRVFGRLRGRRRRRVSVWGDGFFDSSGGGGCVPSWRRNNQAGDDVFVDGIVAGRGRTHQGFDDVVGARPRVVVSALQAPSSSPAVWRFCSKRMNLKMISKF